MDLKSFGINGLIFTPHELAFQFWDIFVHCSKMPPQRSHVSKLFLANLAHFVVGVVVGLDMFSKGFWVNPKLFARMTTNMAYLKKDMK